MQLHLSEHKEKSYLSVSRRTYLKSMINELNGTFSSLADGGETTQANEEEEEVFLQHLRQRIPDCSKGAKVSAPRG